MSFKVPNFSKIQKYYEGQNHDISRYNSIWGRLNLKKKMVQKSCKSAWMTFLGYVNGCSAIERKKGVVDGYRLRIFFSEL